VRASDLELHLLLTVADALACATADLALLADVTDSRALLAGVVALIDGVERHAAWLEIMLARAASP
jgi:hypothetical protein